MKRTLLLSAALLTPIALMVPAQQISNDANPLYRPTTIRMSTISVPPIPGLPFSATATIENKQVMPAGLRCGLAQHQSGRPRFPWADAWRDAQAGSCLFERRTGSH